jgi:histidine triad (HIT) family protein
MDDSIFTKIIKGEIPCRKVYEDDDVIAFLDINPLSDGHVLVVPKEQIDLIWDLDNETYTHLWQTAKNIAQAIQAELNPLRVGVVIEGLDVPHAHIHLVPLYDRDTLQLHHDYPVDISDERLDNIANSIKERLIAI